MTPSPEIVQELCDQAVATTDPAHLNKTLSQLRMIVQNQPERLRIMLTLSSGPETRKLGAAAGRQNA
jgi:hypothetical protein